jgi:hypothetical protein
LYEAIDFNDEMPVNTLIKKFALALEELHKGQYQGKPKIAVKRNLVNM